jgi:hypothetical protein
VGGILVGAGDGVAGGFVVGVGGATVGVTGGATGAQSRSTSRMPEPHSSAPSSTGAQVIPFRAKVMVPPSKQGFTVGMWSGMSMA